MSDQTLRDHVIKLLQGRGAHLDFDSAIDGLSVELRGTKAPGIEHTPWKLLEHLRICQWDILEYSRDPEHVSPEFPVGYWPATDAPPSDDAWEACVKSFHDDLQAMQDLVGDPSIDLTAQIPHGQPGHTVLREALILADHNSYHLGQLVLVRKALGDWPE